MPLSGHKLVQPVQTPQREGARRRVLLAGKVVYGDKNLTLDCAIRDLSDKGARVRLASSVALPAKVHLIEVRSGLAFDCRVTWRNMPEFGLEFEKTYELATAPPEKGNMLRRIWVEAAPR